MTHQTRRYVDPRARALVANAGFLLAGDGVAALFLASYSFGAGGWGPLSAEVVGVVILLSALVVACILAAGALESRARAPRLVPARAAAAAPIRGARVIEVEPGSAEGRPGPLAAAIADAATTRRHAERVPSYNAGRHAAPRPGVHAPAKVEPVRAPELAEQS
jgi:hypothetical protein